MMMRLYILIFLLIPFGNQQLFAQDRTVSGTVVDFTTDEPLPGVNVTIKGTTQGTITDVEGRYSLQIDDPASAILLFSYIGYTTEELAVQNKSVFDVFLTPNIEQLSEVVVVGYGNQKRRDVTYAIASIDSEKIKDMPTTGIDQAIQGQVAGVNVSQASGAPGGGVSVQIRGIQTITAGAEPLYVIDGFPFYNTGGGTGTNPLNTINPADIESIDILKDAAATAIYGSRGANGVIIITTKKGKKGDAKIQFSMYEGIQSLGNSIEMMGRNEFLSFQAEARNNYYEGLGFNPSDNNVNRFLNVGTNAMLIEDTLYQNYSGFNGETKWLDELFRPAPIRNYNLSALGGTDNISYLISGGYFAQEGIVQGTDFDRFSLRANIDAKLNDRISAGVSIAPSLTSNNNQNTAGNFANGGLINSAMVLAPIFPIYEEDGSYFSPRVVGRDRFFTNMVVDGRTINPLRPALPGAENPLKLIDSRINENETFRAIGNLYVELSLLKNLKFRSSVGADFVSSYGRTFNSNLYPSIAGWPRGSASSFANKSLNWLNENTLTYDLNINEVHRLNFVANYSIQKATFEDMSADANQYTDENNTYLNNRFGTVVGASADITYWALESYLARAQYVYKDKYMITASARRDGSSRFGPGNRYGFFPSGSVGWRFTEESFMKDIKLITDGKLRASYGSVGNFNIGNFGWIGLFNGVNYTLGAGAGQPLGGMQQRTMGNSALTWEKSNQFNVGLDLGLLENRLSFIVDYYNIRTEGLLLESKVPFVTGFLDVLRNVGVVENTGLEFSLNSKNLVGKFSWTTNANISFNKNQVIAMSTPGERLFTGSYHVTQEGSPIGSFFLIESDGVYMNEEEVTQDDISLQGLTPYPGARRYVDFDGNGIIDDGDRQVIGNPFPDYTFGVTNNFNFMNFDLSVMLYGSMGAEMINEVKAMSESASGFHNNTMRYWENRFQSPENPGDGQTPKAMATTRIWNNQLRGTHLLEDASFVRIRNITLGYRLPPKVAQRVLMQNARVYTSVQNLYTFTNYTGFDPEVSSGGTNTLLRGIDFGGYPLPRTIIIGLDLTF